MFDLANQQVFYDFFKVNGVMSLYKGRKTAVSVDEEVSNSFSVKIGVHQGSALIPLLFIKVMDILADVWNGSLRSRCMQTILFCVENH